ncbi:MAG: hypothetical protein GY938_01120 [Ketobacter sp.]|nr:hypothetical protein [Ketobacter sp.]
MNCCQKPAVSVINQKGEPHKFCHKCKAHTYNGKFYTLAEWEKYVNKDEDQEPQT